MTAVDTTTRILLVDDHILFREGLRRVLEAEPGYAVVAEASTADEAYALSVTRTNFNLALVDFQLGSGAGNGLTVLRHLRATTPTLPVVLLTGGTHTATLAEAVRSLHASVFLKSEPVSELLLAIRRALDGGVWVSSAAGTALAAEPKLASNPDNPAFTARELRVLRWITEGLSNKQIASQLDISESSAKALLQRLFEKTSVRSRSQLVRYVFESNLELP